MNTTLPPERARKKYASAILYTYQGKYGITREGAVLAAEPFSAKASSVALARLVFVTDGGIGGSEAVNALGFTLDLDDTEKYQPVCDALRLGKYATAVQLAGAAGALK